MACRSPDALNIDPERRFPASSNTGLIVRVGKIEEQRTAKKMRFAFFPIIESNLDWAKT